jgi:hypothetical protein
MSVTEYCADSTIPRAAVGTEINAGTPMLTQTPTQSQGPMMPHRANTHQTPRRAINSRHIQETIALTTFAPLPLTCKRTRPFQPPSRTPARMGPRAGCGSVQHSVAGLAGTTTTSRILSRDSRFRRDFTSNSIYTRPTPAYLEGSGADGV